MKFFHNVMVGWKLKQFGVLLSLCDDVRQLASKIKVGYNYVTFLSTSDFLRSQGSF
jgi:hypothetical protein